MKKFFSTGQMKTGTEDLIILISSIIALMLLHFLEEKNAQKTLKTAFRNDRAGRSTINSGGFCPAQLFRMLDKSSTPLLH
ncbi:MAG: hypothetical protein AAFZ15_09735 [Bacteroidota bacterium]